MQKKYREKLSAFLTQFIYERRISRIDEVLNNRTNYISVVLEDIYQSHNASAVLRSCDCFGIQDIHIIENNYEYSYNADVTKGSEKWLTTKKYNDSENNSLTAIENLKNKGYRIVATTPHNDNTCLPEFELDKGKAALFFGSEKPGLSQDVIKNTDEFLKIPMYGFTESFNISVSAAIILNVLVEKLHLSDINWKLPVEAKEDLRLDWIIKSVKKPDKLIKEFKKLNPEFSQK